jgi:hypothetical protein
VSFPFWNVDFPDSPIIGSHEEEMFALSEFSDDRALATLENPNDLAFPCAILFGYRRFFLPVRGLRGFRKDRDGHGISFHRSSQETLADPDIALVWRKQLDDCTTMFDETNRSDTMMCPNLSDRTETLASFAAYLICACKFTQSGTNLPKRFLSEFETVSEFRRLKRLLRVSREEVEDLIGQRTRRGNHVRMKTCSRCGRRL